MKWNMEMIEECFIKKSICARMTRSNLKIVLRKSLRTQDMVLAERVDGWLLIRKNNFSETYTNACESWKLKILQSFTTLVMVTKVHLLPLQRNGCDSLFMLPIFYVQSSYKTISLLFSLIKSTFAISKRK